MNTLSNLTVTIKDTLDLAEKAGKQMVKHYIEAGHRLQEARDACKHGEWHRYLEQEIGINARTAQRYMKLAANATRVSHLASLREALQVLTEPDYSAAIPEVGMISYGRTKDQSEEYWVAPDANNPGYFFITKSQGHGEASDPLCFRGTEILGGSCTVEGWTRSIREDAVSEGLAQLIHPNKRPKWQQLEMTAWPYNYWLGKHDPLRGAA